ncbi:MAG: class I SAM-dependent methyltransferase [Bacteroidota bacterium]|nr:class I SAM-dependent methyltransferase [Bacteroidota bacterium]
MFQKYKEKRILKKIEAFYQLDGWLSDNEALGLYSIAAMQPRNAIVVEIGSWQGKSTYCISKGLRSGKVYAIDPFNADAGLDKGNEDEYSQKKGDKNLLEKFKNNMQQLNVLSKIVIKKGYSWQFHNDFEKIDFLFIDGDHSIKGCQADFDLYSPRIVPGGFIAFHDYYEDRNELGPTYVIKNIVAKSGEFKFFKQYDTLWVAKK